MNQLIFYSLLYIDSVSIVRSLHLAAKDSSTQLSACQKMLRVKAPLQSSFQQTNIILYSIATVQQSWMMVGVKEVSGHSYCLLHLQKKTLGISDHKQIKRRFNLYLQDNCKGHSYWFTYQSQLASLQEKIFGTGQILMLECQLAIASSVSQHQLSLATSYR